MSRPDPSVCLSRFPEDGRAFTKAGRFRQAVQQALTAEVVVQQRPVDAGGCAAFPPSPALAVGRVQQRRIPGERSSRSPPVIQVDGQHIFATRTSRTLTFKEFMPLLQQEPLMLLGQQYRCPYDSLVKLATRNLLRQVPLRTLIFRLSMMTRLFGHSEAGSSSTRRFIASMVASIVVGHTRRRITPRCLPSG